MTDIDILKDAVRTLGRINIPVELLETVAIPIYRVRSNIMALIKAVDEKLNSIKPEESSDPVIEIANEPEEPENEISESN